MLELEILDHSKGTKPFEIIPSRLNTNNLLVVVLVADRYKIPGFYASVRIQENWKKNLRFKTIGDIVDINSEILNINFGDYHYWKPHPGLLIERNKRILIEPAVYPDRKVHVFYGDAHVLFNTNISVSIPYTY